MTHVSRFSRWKVKLFLLMILLCVFAFLEIATRVYHWQTGRVGAEPTVDVLVPAPYVVHHAPAGFVSDQYQTNDHGFRNGPIDVVAPSGTFRIVVLGGSAVFGLGNSANTSTIPAQLETMLRKRFPERIIEVINAGQPWYNSTQELVQYQTQLSDLRPNMVVAIDGYNDFYHGLRSERELGTPAVWHSHRMEESLRLIMSPHLTLDDIRRPLAKLVLSSDFLYSMIKRAGIPQPARDPFVSEPQGPPENPGLAEVFVRNQRYMAAQAVADGAVYVHAFQPIVTDRIQPLPEERAVLTDPYEQATMTAVQRLVDTARPQIQALVADVGGLSVNVRGTLAGDERLFNDSVHLTDEMCRRMAVVLAETIAPLIDAKPL